MPIVRVGDSGSQEGDILGIAAVSPSPDTVTTAVLTTEARTLTLITFRINNDGSIDRVRHSDDTGEIEFDFGLAHVGFDDARDAYYVTAVRDLGPGTLGVKGESKLISWAANDLTRRDELRVGLGGPGRPFSGAQIEVVSLPGIFQDATGDIRLLVAGDRSWPSAFHGRLEMVPSLLKADGSFENAPSAPGTGGTIESEMSLAVLRRDRIATSVSTAEGNLLVIAWNVNPLDSQAPTQTFRKGEGAAGAAQLIRSAVSARSGHLITSVRTGEGNLKLICWEISDDGNTVARRGDSADQAGAIHSNSLVARPGSNQMISAVQTAAGNLKLILWDVSSDGEQIDRQEGEEAEAGTADRITAVVAGDRIITAVRTGEDTLKLITWELQ